MTTLSLNPLFRRSIGFDRLNDLFEYAMQSEAPNYPPYNIEKHGENEYRIVVATAGFSQNELDINLDNSVLTISGKPMSKTQDNEVAFLHKGIAQRSFKLSLRLDEYIEVQQAAYEDGLLKVDLRRVIPEEKLPRTIAIQGSTGRQQTLEHAQPASGTDSGDQ
ncbi:heat-shock protein [Alkanindiges hydrocarboniclasticus]|jgi:molecular chaperone IbpA|uniref:Heat-shock protein n=1 Tax=Alkanindiges hydrocarboniclasticus TaxID=1907941 RepID=A0A1S8CUI6_9GAMM|nr:Hsp20 family protein [Alkanindiges hydrocarboniclasticus]ONG40821.1 heat-shock protein [Alkanindiges hydrocarboniclasticus]